MLFRNASYDGQLMRTLAAAMAGSADLGEALATARRIGKPNGTAWYEAWSRTADQARQTAEKARASGERVNARHSFLRASEYYRQAFTSYARISTTAAFKTPTAPTSARSERLLP